MSLLLISRARGGGGRGFTLVQAIKLFPLPLLRPPSTIIRASLPRPRCYDIILRQTVPRVLDRSSRTSASFAISWTKIVESFRKHASPLIVLPQPGQPANKNHRYAAVRNDSESKRLESGRYMNLSVGKENYSRVDDTHMINKIYDNI